MPALQEKERPPKPTFLEFTENSRMVFASARRHAQRLNNNNIGEGHIFLALIEDPSILKNLNRDPEKLKEATDSRMVPNARIRDETGYGYDHTVKEIIKLAATKARRRNNLSITPTHLLEGAVAVGVDRFAIQVLLQVPCLPNKSQHIVAMEDIMPKITRKKT